VYLAKGSGNRCREALDQLAFDRLKVEKSIGYKVLEQLIRIQIDAGCPSTGDKKSLNQGSSWCSGDGSFFSPSVRGFWGLFR
jgi:hypothetical protein